jgi:hypothetical protein
MGSECARRHLLLYKGTLNLTTFADFADFTNLQSVIIDLPDPFENHFYHLSSAISRLTLGGVPGITTSLLSRITDAFPHLVELQVSLRKVLNYDAALDERHLPYEGNISMFRLPNSAHSLALQEASTQGVSLSDRSPSCPILTSSNSLHRRRLERPWKVSNTSRGSILAFSSARIRYPNPTNTRESRINLCLPVSPIRTSNDVHHSSSAVNTDTDPITQRLSDVWPKIHSRVRSRSSPPNGSPSSISKNRPVGIMVLRTSSRTKCLLHRACAFRFEW